MIVLTSPPTEAEANALGFSVTRGRHDQWWDLCWRNSRPFVIVHCRRKYASVWGDDGTARPWNADVIDGWTPHQSWHDHEKLLLEMTHRAARRAIKAGYRDWIASSDHDISTCLIADAAPMARVLVEVWDGDSTGLERLLSEWQAS